MRKLIITGLAGLLLVGTAIKSNESMVDYNLEDSILYRGLVLNPYIEQLQARNLTNVILEEPEDELLEGKFPEIKIRQYIDSIFNEIEIPDYITKEFIRSQIWAESRDYPNALGDEGKSRGLMQISFGAWNQVEKQEDYYEMAFDPEKNVNSGTKYDVWIANFLEKYHPNWNEQSPLQKRRLIAVSYNWGIGKLRESGWNLEKIPDRTKRYLSWIEGNLERINP